MKKLFISSPKFVMLITLIGMGIGIFSCTRIKDYIVPTTWLVFPTDSGKYAIYHVIDSAFTIPAERDEYYRKEEIGGKVIIDNREVNRMITYRSEFINGLNFQFEVDRVWSLYKDTTQYAETIKENVRELVLKYPVYADTTYTWDPYLYAETMDKHNLRYHYLNIDTTVTVGNETFEHCVVVMESTREDTLTNTLKYRKAYTVYAPHIGKIRRFYRQLDFTGSNPTIPQTETSAIHIEEIVEHN